LIEEGRIDMKSPGLDLSQRLKLEQRLAPQLIQSLQLLQLSTLELEQLLKQELEINPFLEETTDLVEVKQGETTEEPREEKEKEIRSIGANTFAKVSIWDTVAERVMGTKK
jgi:RNA polymerase sigma-54 factor